MFPNIHESYTNARNKNVVSNISRTRAQKFKSHYNSHLVQSSVKRPSNILCNYYFKLGHISIECKVRKKNNKTNIIWVPKSKE
jgi:hypothetical protein